ncbi:hypothetical protein CBS63078_5438 [Aspergillus niger]|nr:hypothetical protein CBS133816_10454 [Aspergillus niger]KAI2819628.1 hypothetical protein CBS115989_4236 [Aspergillus niger]KAI2835390.1 hypothetical protein CBS11350_10078 [Aspergillus niger]KAI2855364.1 hypothetical protein CBS11232_4399 [Aspergillus niger]KAI2866711.1 hypothetical protein CBS12448_1007 [Aspergillus niger]
MHRRAPTELPWDAGVYHRFGLCGEPIREKISKPISIPTNFNMSSAVVHSDDLMEPTLQSVVNQKTLRWIFVGGKGGVGKTTTSCSLAIQLAKVRKSVLLISTDPAHNLSDAFGQKFGKEARLVDGYTNLSAMEIDPNGSIQDLLASGEGQGDDPLSGMGVGGMMQDLAFSIPGVDEAMSFAEVLKQVKSLSYEVIVFDTAPTGHTLRFLQFPTVLEKALAKLSQLSSQFGPMLNSILGSRGGLPGGQNIDELLQKMESLRETISEVNSQFKDADLTTFVCVCIAEFLSLYETERMIQELTSYNIDTHAIVVNQLLFPKQSSECEQCNARRKMQKKYLEQIEELYEDFNVVRMPLLVEEVRGKEKLEKFSDMLVNPCYPDPCGRLLQIFRDEIVTRTRSPVGLPPQSRDSVKQSPSPSPIGSLISRSSIASNSFLLPRCSLNIAASALVTTRYKRSGSSPSVPLAEYNLQSL